MFNCINCIKMFGRAGENGLCLDPLGSPREGREERMIEGGREVSWTPKIYDRSPPLPDIASTCNYSAKCYLQVTTVFQVLIVCIKEGWKAELTYGVVYHRDGRPLSLQSPIQVVTGPDGAQLR